MDLQTNFLLLLSLLCIILAGGVAGSPGQESYYATTPAPPICACEEAVTKVVLQEMNRTVMVPQFVPYPKEFAQFVGQDFVDVPRFTEDRDREEIILEPEVTEKKVRVVNVQYDWKEVRRRSPLFNRTTIQVDEYRLDTPKQYVNHIVQRVPTPIRETEVFQDIIDIVNITVRENLTILRPEVIEFTDYPVDVEEVIFQDVVEYVEKIEKKSVDVYVWKVELYDEDFYQKEVIPRDVPPVTIDHILISKKPVPIPIIKYTQNPNPVLVHDPVQIIRVPVPDPEFYNQTYKTAREIRKTIPVPVIQDVPVEVPEYFKGVCELPGGPHSSYLPPMCHCDACAPCAVCPTDPPHNLDIGHGHSPGHGHNQGHGRNHPPVQPQFSPPPPSSGNHFSPSNNGFTYRQSRQSAQVQGQGQPAPAEFGRRVQNLQSNSKTPAVVKSANSFAHPVAAETRTYDDPGQSGSREERTWGGLSDAPGFGGSELSSSLWGRTARAFGALGFAFA